MSTTEQTRNNKAKSDSNGTAQEGRSKNLRDSAMMSHLLDALEEGKDVGHYGRLTFAMIARHFLDDEELVRLLSNQPEQDETKARALVLQVEGRDYNPPKRERILEWQAQQDFPICPTPDDPNSCNVYSELQFPENIYDNINEFYEEQAQAS
jgi:DNA primase large subunit